MNKKRITILTTALGLSAIGALCWHALKTEFAVTETLPPQPKLTQPIKFRPIITNFNMPERPVTDDVVFSLIAAGKTDDAIARFEKEKLGINILQPQTGYTPYVVAAKRPPENMLRYLDRRNADMTIEVFSGNPVLISAYLNAATEGCLPVVRYLVEEKKVDINATSKVWKETALYKAADGHHTELARYLLEKGIDRWASNNNGRTPLTVAKEKGYADIVALIEQNAPLR